jgi:flagellar biosynthetic protein FlhB
MAEDLGDRTEDATPKRRSEARDEGNVAKSHDLAGALMLLAMTAALWATVMHMLAQGKSIMGEALLSDSLSRPFDLTQAGELAQQLALAGVRISAPLILIAWVAAALSHGVQIGWVFSPKAAQPSFRKLNPLKGFKRIFGLSGLVKSSLDAVKVSIVIAIAVFTIVEHASEIVVLPYLSMMQALGRVGEMMLNLAMRVLAVLLVLGILDFLYQRWKHLNDLKMTKQQVKDEMKQSEGDPDVKRRRMRIQRQIAMQRISTSVPKADVIVTNPEHISIAIQYDASAMGAPKVVAKGADYIALRIRQIALQHGIPIVERKPLARALYKQVGVNQEIPPTFYKAVAEILAYVYRLSGRAAG